MSAEVVAKILAIAADEEHDGYVVQFWVGKEFNDTPTLNEAFALLGSMDSLQRTTYSFMVRWEENEFTMEPDEALAECLAIYDQYGPDHELGPPLDRQWKTGQVAEALVTQLVHANVFGAWRTIDLSTTHHDLEDPSESDPGGPAQDDIQDEPGVPDAVPDPFEETKV